MHQKFLSYLCFFVGTLRTDEDGAIILKPMGRNLSEWSGTEGKSNNRKAGRTPPGFFVAR
jgi:hypothetical protein